MLSRRRGFLIITSLLLSACHDEMTSQPPVIATAPVFTTEPADVAVAEGQKAQFIVAASGTPTPALRWQLSTDSGSSWSDIVSATADVFEIPAATPADNGHQFQVVASNGAGSVKSAAATLTVTPAVNHHSTGCGKNFAHDGMAAMLSGLRCNSVSERFYRCNFTSSSLSRTFYLAVPAQYRSDQPYALLFGWHGSSWSGASFARPAPYFPVEDYANEGVAHRAFVIYPDGLPGAAQGATRPPGFVELTNNTGWDLRINGYDTRLFDDIKLLVESSVCIDRRQVLSFGTSYGGWFNQILSCARAGSLRASASSSAGEISSFVGNACDMVKLPYLQMHNRLDPVVGITLAEQARAFWAAPSRNACTLTAYASGDPLVSCRRYTQCSKAALLWCETNQATHTPYFVNESDNAGRAAWRFFSEIIQNDRQ